MNYGLYLSATGVINSAYRQDVISNNMANLETVGFKKDLATFAQRLPASQENIQWAGLSNSMLDKIGGGALASPTRVDTSEGVLEPTGNDLDAAISGPGFFTVSAADGQQRLTRDGRFRLNNTGQLTLGTDQANPVLDSQGRPIVLDPTQSTRINITGQVLQNEKPVAQLGVVDVPDTTKLKSEGGLLLSYPDPASETTSNAQLEDGFVERSNVDAATELTQLMDTQRQLEANANMIHYQDQTLGDLVNTVGRIG